MFRTVTREVKRAFIVVIYGLRILRWCGLRIFINKSLHQLYGRTIFLVTVTKYDEPLSPSNFECTVGLASPDDMKGIFNGLRSESREGRYQLLVRMWYHEHGFGDCYITKTADTNEICHVRWLVTAKHIKQMGWEDRFPLDEDEERLENQYTFERFRGEGVRRATNIQMRKIVQQLGYCRGGGYVDETNIEQRRHYTRIGTLVRARILERHFLFRVTRNTLERYDPPVPIQAPPDS